MQTCEFLHWYTYLIWGRTWWPQSHCSDRAAERWALVQRGQGWSDPTPHSPRDSPSPSAGAPSSRTQPSAEDRQTQVRIETRKNITNKQTRHAAGDIYTHNICIIFYKASQETQCWKQTELQALVCVQPTALFVLYNIHTMNHSPYRNHSMRLLTLNSEYFLKLVKFKSVCKICFLEGREDDWCHCVIMQYLVFHSHSEKSHKWKKWPM